MLKKTYLVCLSLLLNITDLVRCDPDYVFNVEAGGWFKLYSAPEPWKEAFKKCHYDGAVLASPLNKELAKALLSQMAQSGVNGHIFLGTHDMHPDGAYASVEGVPLSDMYIRWGPRGADTGDCLTMSVEGSSYSLSCKEPLPFVCYRKLYSQTMNECGTFDNEYRLNPKTGSCYKVHLEEQAWTRAYEICDAEGAHLVILNDEEEARIVKDMFPVNQGIQFHIGLRALGNERIWTTIHGERIEDVFNRWNTNQPDNWYGTQDRATFLRNGYLDDVQPWTVAMFVCEKPPHLGDSSLEYRLNPKTGSSYKVHIEEQTWTRANEVCDTEGGHLVILNDDEEARIVKDMFPVNQGIQFHIGLQALGKERIWTTIHGERIEDVFNRWNTNQPDNWYGTQDRATFLRNGYLDDVQPWTVAMFVCEKPPLLEDSTLEVPLAPPFVSRWKILMDVLHPDVAEGSVRLQLNKNHPDVPSHLRKGSWERSILPQTWLDYLRGPPQVGRKE